MDSVTAVRNCRAWLGEMMPAEINTDFPGIYVIARQVALNIDSAQTERVKASQTKVTENRYTRSAGNCGQLANAGYAWR